MTDEVFDLPTVLRERRQALGLSAREVARRANVDVGTVTRLELGQIRSPRQDNLKAIAEVLDLSLSDVFAAADWVSHEQLPTFAPYLRTKYRDLPESALAELTKDFERLARKHGLTPDGPQRGEDER